MDVSTSVELQARRSGGSAAAAYLRRSRARRIAEAYQKAYARGPALGDDWAAWEDEGTWPAK